MAMPPLTRNSPRILNFIGTKHGLLTAVQLTELKPRKTVNGHRQVWQFLCDCGKTTVAYRENVENGNTSSCGCQERKKHGFCTRKVRHPAYGVWMEMVQRCTNPKNKGWKNYGGRGIRVCDRWRIAKNFLSDMVPTWQKGLTLDRKNNDGNYEPENCRWVTWGEQGFNKRKRA